MSDQIHWPTVEVRRAANGWMVRPCDRGNWGNETATFGPESLYVFNSWSQCAEFLQAVTTTQWNMP